MTRGLGGTGVVGTLKNGAASRSIGLRADMDALPITEINQFPHRSKHEGKMHACGHDGHTAMLLAAAKYLAETRPFDGTVHLIFQPGEEGGAGAQRMIDDGLFDRFPCGAVFGMHNWPNLKVGEFGLTAGPMMASSNEFAISVRGRGAHAAMPHLGVDPVFVAVQIVNGLQAIITRVKKPIESAVLSVTMIRAGEATNVIPESAQPRRHRAHVQRCGDCAGRGTDETHRRDDRGGARRGGRRRVSLELSADGQPRAETEFAATVMDDIVGAANVVRGYRTDDGLRGLRVHAEGLPRGLRFHRQRRGVASQRRTRSGTVHAA